MIRLIAVALTTGLLAAIITHSALAAALIASLAVLIVALSDI